MERKGGEGIGNSAAHRAYIPGADADILRWSYLAGRERRERRGETTARFDRAIYDVSKLHVVSREIYGVGRPARYPVSLVSTCSRRGTTSYYRGEPIYRAPVSDRDLFDAPIRPGDPTPPPPLRPSPSAAGSPPEARDTFDFKGQL